MNASLAPSAASSRPGSRNSSNQANYDASGLQEPVLPWMGTRASFQSIVSDVHIMKRRLPEGAPILPVKTWRRWTWHKVWLTLMNALVR
jgi:hypothetical protein